MGIGVSVRRDLKDNTVNTGCSLVQTNHASKVAHAKRKIMAVVTHASVHQDTLDLTVRRKWTNVPHCNAPMVRDQTHITAKACMVLHFYISSIQ